MAPREISFASERAGILLGAAALVVIVGYSLYAALPFLLGPLLHVTVSEEGALVTVSGITERVSFLNIAGAPVPLEEDGSFSVERAYPPGYTALVVVARDRFGRTVTKTFTFLTHALNSYGAKKEN